MMIMYLLGLPLVMVGSLGTTPAVHRLTKYKAHRGLSIL